MANSYESGQQKNIPAVLLYVFSKFSDGTERVLMIHRNSKERPDDFHAGKWNGLGGKCDPGESYRQTAARELHEESTLKIAPEKFHFIAHLTFPNFKPLKAEDWSCMLFWAEVDEAAAKSVPASVNEGSLHWIEKEKVPALNLWDGDHHFIQHVIAKRSFTGCIWYIDGKAAKSEITPT